MNRPFLYMYRLLEESVLVDTKFNLRTTLE